MVRHVSVVRHTGPLKRAGMWTYCMRILELLNVWCILLEIFRQLFHNVHDINENVNLTLYGPCIIL